jgi:phosphate starvation-inducible PhoH-like protein
LSKRRSKTQAQTSSVAENAVCFSSYAVQKKPINLVPKTLNQEKYIDMLTDWEKLIVFATGPAGTGKTMLAVLAAIKALRHGEINKIIITRPAVGVDDETHGFLPGDLNQKMEPWTRPIIDVMLEYYKPQEIDKMLEEKTLEIAPLAYMRGRNFRNSWIIFDESQNATVNQMKMALTRLSIGSKMVVTGDLNQLDKQFRLDNGLKDFIERLQKANSQTIGVVHFATKDVQRHPVVTEVLKLYGEI